VLFYIADSDLGQDSVFSRRCLSNKMDLQGDKNWSYRKEEEEKN